MKFQAESKMYLSVNEVAKLINLSASSIRRLEIADDFPRKRKLSARRVGYVLSEVQIWAENRNKA